MLDVVAPLTATIAFLVGRPDHFGENLVSRGRGTVNPWAPHIPDLNVLNAYLWSYSKDLQTLDELRDSITADIRGIPTDHSLNVMSSFVNCARKCIDQNRRHIENLLSLDY